MQLVSELGKLRLERLNVSKVTSLKNFFFQVDKNLTSQGRVKSAFFDLRESPLSLSSTLSLSHPLSLLSLSLPFLTLTHSLSVYLCLFLSISLSFLSSLYLFHSLSITHSLYLSLFLLRFVFFFHSMSFLSSLFLYRFHSISTSLLFQLLSYLNLFYLVVSLNNGFDFELRWRPRSERNDNFFLITRLNSLLMFKCNRSQNEVKSKIAFHLIIKSFTSKIDSDASEAKSC